MPPARRLHRRRHSAPITKKAIKARGGFGLVVIADDGSGSRHGAIGGWGLWVAGVDAACGRIMVPERGLCAEIGHLRRGVGVDGVVGRGEDVCGAADEIAVRRVGVEGWGRGHGVWVREEVSDGVVVVVVVSEIVVEADVGHSARQVFISAFLVVITLAHFSVAEVGHSARQAFVSAFLVVTMIEHFRVVEGRGNAPV